MSVVVWVMVGIAIWHFTVLLPDLCAGGRIGSFVTCVAGALASGYLLPTPGVPTSNPPGIQEALWPVPGTLMALAATYAYGAWRGDEPLR